MKSAARTEKNTTSHYGKSARPEGDGWESASIPGVTDEAAYALEITGNSMQPVYREGDTIIVSPAAEIRNGDRVVVRTKDGQVMAKILQKQTKRTIELASFNSQMRVKSLDVSSVGWMARIIWASQ